VLICVHSNERSGSIEGEELICEISDCQFSNKGKDPVLWSSSVLLNIQGGGIDIKPDRKSTIYNASLCF
jgi:hypothetical protein